MRSGRRVFCGTRVAASPCATASPYDGRGGNTATLDLIPRAQKPDRLGGHASTIFAIRCESVVISR